jgi:methionyl-tRNA synthetase
MKFTHYKLIEAKRAPHGLPAISRYMCDECKSFHTSPDLAELCCDQSCRHCGKPLPPGKLMTPYVTYSGRVMSASRKNGIH